jgi:hypothetical protein
MAATNAHMPIHSRYLSHVVYPVYNGCQVQTGFARVVQTYFAADQTRARPVAHVAWVAGHAMAYLFALVVWVGYAKENHLLLIRIDIPQSTLQGVLAAHLEAVDYRRQNCSYVTP